jgi:hypothetical protein
MADRKAFLLSDLKNHLRLKVSGVENIQLVWIDEKKRETVISEITVPKGHNPIERKF